jgi:hypothetical protein
MRERYSEKEPSWALGSMMRRKRMSLENSSSKRSVLDFSYTYISAFWLGGTGMNYGLMIDIGYTCRKVSD